MELSHSPSRRWVVGILLHFLLGATCCLSMKIAMKTTTPPPLEHSPENEAREPPKISLLNSTHDFEQDLGYYEPPTSGKEVTFQNETVVVVPASRNSLRFLCEANYPIFWNLVHSKISHNVYHSLRVLSIRQFQDPFDPLTFTYQTILHMQGYRDQMSGIYRCQSSHRQELESSIQVFWQSATTGSVLLHSRENLTVWIDHPADNFVLPCEVTDPKVTPKLSKLSQPPNEIYVEVEWSDSQFSPLQGFTMKNGKNGVGTYRCSIQPNGEYVTVNVRLRNETSGAANQPKYTFQYDDQLKQVKCCANGGDGKKRKPPKIYMMVCEHPSTCALRETLTSNEDLAYMWNQGRRRGSCSVYSLKSPHNTGVIRCTGDGYSVFKEFVVPVRGAQEQHHWNTKRNTTTYFHWSEIDSQEMVDVVRTSSASAIYQTYYYDEFGRRRLEKLDPTVYSRQRVHFNCYMSRYYFASGNYWLIRWKNQTLTAVPSGSGEDESGGVEVAPRRYYQQHEHHVDTVSFVASREMEAVICFAPVWNSSVWVTKLHYLYVNESMPPAILATEQKLVWYANETEKVLTCHSNAVPEPMFRWEKDNQTIMTTTHNYDVIKANDSTSTSTTTTEEPTSSLAPDTPIEEDEDNSTTLTNGTVVYTSLLRISRVSYGTAGVFRCIASNFAGEAQIEFHVTVLEPTSWKGPVALVSASVITVVLMVAIILSVKRVWANRQGISKLASSVNSNDVARRNGGSGGGGGSNTSTITAGCSITSTGSSSNGTGTRSSRPAEDDGIHYSSFGASFDNGKMTNNLIDGF